MSHTFSEDKSFSNNTKDQLHPQATQQKKPLGHIDRIEAELNILDDDYMMSSHFRICKECGNDHSFKDTDPKVPNPFFKGNVEWLNNNNKTKTLNETSYRQEISHFGYDMQVCRHCKQYGTDCEQEHNYKRGNSENENDSLAQNRQALEEVWPPVSNALDVMSSSQQIIQKKMTINILSEDNDKLFDVNAQCYIFCDQCAWYGFPNEKIVRIFHGLRPEDEDGFIYDYTEYDYDSSGKNRIIHIHKYNPKIIEQLIRIALENQKGVIYVK